MSNQNIFNLYKPLRNHLKQVPLLESLAVIRAYYQHLQFGNPLPKDVQSEPWFLSARTMMEKKVFEWEIEVLVREIILNGSDNSLNCKTLKNFQYFSLALNKLKKLEDDIVIEQGDSINEVVLQEIYRISHRQFPWQTRPNLICMTRYYKIFSHKELDLIIKRLIGMSTKDLYTLGVAFTGSYLDYFSINYPPELQLIGIDQKKLDSFLNHFSVDLDSIKIAIKSSQSYDQDYVYSLNPLKAYPIIRTNYNGKDSLICPIPTYLFRRFTEGVFYEICNDPNFSNPFGQSFQDYIGEVLNKANVKNNYEVISETEYFIGKNMKNTVDWIAVDKDCNLFVECKTKKLQALSKIALIDNKTLNEDLSKMADSVVQIYKTIIDYENGFYPNLKPNNRQVFPLVVTLEEWYIYGKKIINDYLDTKIVEKLNQAGINNNVLELMPYSICATEDFEKIMQIINNVGIKAFMGNKTDGEKKIWLFQSFMFDAFPDEYKNVKELFPDEHRQINQALQTG